MKIRRRRCARLAAATLLCLGFVAFVAAAPYAYVSNEVSASVSVIDVASDKVVETLAIGRKPRGIALSSDGQRLYISNQGTNARVVDDTAKRAEPAKIPLGESPEAIYLSPDGKSLSAAIEDDDAVAIVDIAKLAISRNVKMKGKNTKIAEIPVGELPWGVAIR